MKLGLFCSTQSVHADVWFFFFHFNLIYSNHIVAYAGCNTNEHHRPLSFLQIHSIHQRRKVVGRSKNFDQLVAELKMVSKNRERNAQIHEESAAQSPSPETPREPNASPGCRRPLINSPAFRYELESEHHRSRGSVRELHLLNLSQTVLYGASESESFYLSHLSSRGLYLPYESEHISHFQVKAFHLRHPNQSPSSLTSKSRLGSESERVIPQNCHKAK